MGPSGDGVIDGKVISPGGCRSDGSRGIDRGEKKRR